MVKFIFYEILDFKLKYYTTMSFIAPYAFTGAVSLYLGYKTYESYYSNCEFEEIGNEENILSEQYQLEDYPTEFKPAVGSPEDGSANDSVYEGDF